MTRQPAHLVRLIVCKRLNKLLILIQWTISKKDNLFKRETNIYDEGSYIITTDKRHSQLIENLSKLLQNSVTPISRSHPGSGAAAVRSSSKFPGVLVKHQIDMIGAGPAAGRAAKLTQTANTGISCDRGANAGKPRHARPRILKSTIIRIF